MLQRLLARAGASVGPFSLLRGALATGVLAVLAMAPIAALAASPGCDVMNSGRYDRSSTTNYYLSDGARFVRGDVITLNYTQTRAGGTLRFIIGGTEYNATDASGTITVPVNGLVEGSTLTTTWQGDYSTVASCTPGLDVPVGINQTVEVGPDSTDNLMYPSFEWRGANATSTRIGSPPSHGSAALSNGEVLYTPDAGFVGLDSFQFIGTNAEGDSDPATITIRVADALGMSPGQDSVLPQATIDQPYSFQFTGLNCVGGCSFSLSDTTFNDGDMSIDPSTGVLSGTPTSFNVYTGEPEHSPGNLCERCVRREPRLRLHYADRGVGRTYRRGLVDDHCCQYVRPAAGSCLRARRARSSGYGATGAWHGSC